MKTELYLHQPVYLMVEPRREDCSSWNDYLKQRARWITENNKQLRLRPFLKNYAQNGVVNEGGATWMPTIIHARPTPTNQ